MKTTTIPAPAIALLVLLTGIAASACGGGGGGGEEVRAFTVYTTSPEGDATDVRVTTDVTVLFSGIVDPGTITRGSFAMADEAGTPVSATVSTMNEAAFLRPSSPLESLTTYVVTLSTEIRSVDGVPLGSHYSWRFTTRLDGEAPTVPENVDARPQHIAGVYVRWDASDDDTSVAGYNVYRDGEYLLTTTDTSVIDQTLGTGSLCSYAVSAFDDEGNESARSTSVWSTTMWIVTTAREAGALQFVGRYNTIAVDGSGDPRCAFQDSDLSLGYGDRSSGAWVFTTVSPGDQVQETDLALDSLGKSHVVYYESTQEDLRYATNASGGWVVTTIDDTGDVGRQPAVAVDTNDKVHIVYLASTHPRIRYATNTSGSWTTTAVDVLSTMGWCPSIAIDAEDHAHVAFGDPSTAVLRYAHNFGGGFAATTVDTQFLCIDTAIAVDSDGDVHISYVDGEARYATNESGSWNTELIDSGGECTDLALNSSEEPVITWYWENVVLARRIEGEWIMVHVDHSGEDVGKEHSLAIDGTGGLHVLYVDALAHRLQYATDFIP